MELTIEEIKIMLRANKYASETLLNWMTPEEYRILSDLANKLYNEWMRLDKLDKKEKGK